MAGENNKDTEQNTVEPKKAKAPAKKKAFVKFFKADYKTKVFEKKVLKNIFLPKEKEFLLDFYDKDEEGYHLKDSFRDQKKALDPKVFKRLDTLAKSIKKMGGPVDFVKIALVVGVLAAVIVINLFFLGGWVQGAVVDSLQGAFQAKVELSGFQLDLFAGNLGFENLAIADKNNPMQNLMEMDQARLSLDTGEMLSGRIHITNITAQGMRWGTPRQTNGALSPEELPPEEDSGEEGLLAIPDLGNLIPPELQSLDAEALLEAELEKLETPKLLEEANGFFQETYADWNTRVNAITTEIEETSVRANRLARTDVRSINSLNQVQSILSDVEELQASIVSLASKPQEALDAAQTDLDQVLDYQERIVSAIENDGDYLVSLVDLPAGGVEALGANLMLGPINQALGEYQDLAWTLVEFLENMKQEDPSEAEGEQRPEGEVLPVFVPSKPFFLLRQADISLGTQGQPGFQSLSLSNINNQPQVFSPPMRMAYQANLDGPILSIDGEMDLHDPEASGFRATVGYSGQKFALEEGLETFLIDGISGTLNVSGEFSGSSQDEYSLILNLSVDDLEARWLETGEVQTLVSRILARANPMTGQVELTFQEGNMTTLLATNLDGIIQQEVGAWLNEKIQEVATAVLVEFRALISSALGENEVLADEILGVLDELEAGDLTLDNAQERLNTKKREIERRIANFATDAANQFLEDNPEARDAVDNASDAVNDALGDLDLGGFGF